MRYDYTQTILSCQRNGLGKPDFLKTFGDYVQIYVSETPLAVIIADEDTHYLVEERNGVQRAWGPFDSQDGNTYHLYIDVNAVTASVTRGYTLLQPVYSSVQPQGVAGSHWYDTVNHKMMAHNGETWEPVIRLFVASYSSNALITYNTFALMSCYMINCL